MAVVGNIVTRLAVEPPVAGRLAVVLGDGHRCNGPSRRSWFQCFVSTCSGPEILDSGAWWWLVVMVVVVMRVMRVAAGV